MKVYEQMFTIIKLETLDSLSEEHKWKVLSPLCKCCLLNTARRGGMSEIILWVLWNLNLGIPSKSYLTSRPLPPWRQRHARRSQQTNVKRHLRSRSGVICRGRSVISEVHCWQQSADNRRITIGRRSLTKMLCSTTSEEPAVHGSRENAITHTLTLCAQDYNSVSHASQDDRLDTFVTAISSPVHNTNTSFIMLFVPTNTVLSGVTTLTHIF